MTILTKNTDKLREEVAAIADTFRALCAELTAWAEKTSAHYFQPPDEPAVPEGKKPTRDELWELWLRLNNELSDRPAAVAEFWEHAQIDARARAAELLQQQAPQPPADGEVAGLVADLQQQANHGFSEFISRNDLLRAAELLQRQVPWPFTTSSCSPSPTA